MGFSETKRLRREKKYGDILFKKYAINVIFDQSPVSIKLYLVGTFLPTT